MNVVVQLGPQDLVHAQRLHFRQYLRTPNGLIRLTVVYLVMILVYAGLLISLGPWDEVLVPTVVFAIVSPFVIVCLLFLITYATGPALARKTFGQQKSLQKPFSLSWTESGVSFGSDYGNALLQWSDFVKARQDLHVILLYESDHLYRIIPKRVLAVEQISSLSSCIHTA